MKFVETHILRAHDAQDIQTQMIIVLHETKVNLQVKDKDELLIMFSVNKHNFTVWELPQDAIVRYGWGALCDLAVSADGMYLATGTGVGVWWYDLTTRQPVTLFETERGMVNNIALCSSQSLLAVKNTDKDGKEVIKIWDMLRQKRMAVMAYPPRLRGDPPLNYLCSLCFSPSGRWLAASRAGSVIVDIWESLTGRLHTELKLSSEEIELCCNDYEFSGDFSGVLGVFTGQSSLGIVTQSRFYQRLGYNGQ